MKQEAECPCNQFCINHMEKVNRYDNGQLNQTLIFGSLSIVGCVHFYKRHVQYLEIPTTLQWLIAFIINCRKTQIYKIVKPPINSFLITNLLLANVQNLQLVKF